MNKTLNASSDVNINNKQAPILKLHRLTDFIVNTNCASWHPNSRWYRLAAMLIRNSHRKVRIKDFCDDPPITVCRWLTGHVRLNITFDRDDQSVVWNRQPVSVPFAGQLSGVYRLLKQSDEYRSEALADINKARQVQREAAEKIEQAQHRLNSIKDMIVSLKSRRTELIADAYFPVISTVLAEKQQNAENAL
jgi:hypothetical protein